jgi:hypothetical protein
VLAAGGAAQAGASQPVAKAQASTEAERQVAQVVVPAPSPPVVVPVQPAPAQPVETAPRKTVVVEDKPQNFMATIAMSTIFGVVTGALLGAAVYYLDEPRRDPHHIYYWGAGGAVVGMGIGLINVAANQDRSERAVSELRRKPMRDTGPRPIAVRVFSARF